MAKKDKGGKKDKKALKKVAKADAVRVDVHEAADHSIPDEIAGVKVPPKLRQAAEQLKDLARNPVAQDIATDLAAAALMAAAAKIAGNPKTRAKVAEAIDDAEDRAEAAAHKASASSDAMKTALLSAARTLLNNIEVGKKG